MINWKYRQYGKQFPFFMIFHTFTDYHISVSSKSMWSIGLNTCILSISFNNNIISKYLAEQIPIRTLNHCIKSMHQCIFTMPNPLKGATLNEARGALIREQRNTEDTYLCI